MNRFMFALAFAGLLNGLTPPPARADLTISLSDVTLLAGQTTGTMDITVSYVDNPSSVDNSNTLSAWSFALLITPQGSGPDLGFSSTQSNPWDNAVLGTNYVFAGTSLAQAAPPFWSPPTLTTNPDDTILAGDFYYSSDPTSPGYVTIPTSPTDLNSYLATVQFTAAVVATTETFQVSLVPAFTSFSDQNGGNLPYTTTGGLVTIDGQPQVSGTPEPSAFIMALVGGLGFMAYGWLSRSRIHRRRAASTA